MCGPRQLFFFQCGGETTPKGRTPLFLPGLTGTLEEHSLAQPWPLLSLYCFAVVVTAHLTAQPPQHGKVQKVQLVLTLWRRESGPAPPSAIQLEKAWGACLSKRCSGCSVAPGMSVGLKGQGITDVEGVGSWSGGGSSRKWAAEGARESGVWECVRTHSCVFVRLAPNRMSLVHGRREPTLDLMCCRTFCPLRFSSTLALQEAIRANEKQTVLWETGNLVPFMTAPGPAVECWAAPLCCPVLSVSRLEVPSVCPLGRQGLAFLFSLQNSASVIGC